MYTVCRGLPRPPAIMLNGKSSCYYLCPKWSLLVLTHNVLADVSISEKEADVALHFKSVFGHISPLHIVETDDQDLFSDLGGERGIGSLVRL